MNCEVDLEVEHCNFSMVSENEVEVRAIVNVNVKVSDETQYSLATEALKGRRKTR